MHARLNIKVERSIFSNLVYQLILLNSILVIVAYGINTYTGSSTQNLLLNIKSFFLFSSIGVVIATKPVRLYSVDWRLFLLLFFLILSVLWSSNINYSFDRVVKLIVPLLYVIYSIKILLTKFGFKESLKGFVVLLCVVYSIPIIMYYSFGGGFAEVNIYGFDEDKTGSFVSNHYGWSSVIFICSSIVVMSIFKLNNLFKIYFIVFAVLSVYLLLVSANRASWLSLLLVLFFLIFKSSRLKFYYSAGIVIVLLSFIGYLSSSEDSALYFVLDKNINQSAEGEPRVLAAQEMAGLFNYQMEYWLFGVGFANDYYLDKADLGIGDYHNTYYEILFGCGLLVFILYIYIMLVKPLLKIYNEYLEFFPIVIPIVVIPYFENNLTAGQFLFFPFVIFSSFSLLKLV